ncbi:MULTISPECIES: hypothetical protein [unclassified Arthrobacter]|uniref:hypothetical protein n=1 Tax=unclassified Arthrobacter TaxID=235627 RepID=UPI002226BC89|nr:MULTISPECIES: hypothetical protein [unclassified Arthrobacter]UYY81610.1 hypothetical protein OIT41_00585 [Arthrobacter sp. YA7-1]
MRRLWAAIALTTTAALCSGCEPQVTVCPAIAMAPVVSLTITAEYAPTVRTVHLKACQDGKCREGDVDLRPGSVSVPQSCSPEPEGSCSAVTSPDGTRYGFLNMGTLTSSPIDAEVTGTDTTGGTLPVRTINFTPRTAKPWGEQCQTTITASLLLDAHGLRQS